MKQTSEFVIIVLYVDNLILKSNSSNLLSKVPEALKKSASLCESGE